MIGVERESKGMHDLRKTIHPVNLRAAKEVLFGRMQANRHEQEHTASQGRKNRTAQG